MDLPLKIQILKAFIDNGEDHLTPSEIAKYCQSSIQAVSYQLKQMEETLLLTKEHNNITAKTYYYINEFFLNSSLLEEARNQLQPFADFYTKYFRFNDQLDDHMIETNLIVLIMTVAWLFADGHIDTQKSLDSSQ